MAGAVAHMIGRSVSGGGADTDFVFDGTQSSITRSVPQTGAAILLSGEIRSARAGVPLTGVLIQINGDVTNYYARSLLAGNATISASASDSAGTPGQQLRIPAANAPAAEACAIFTIIPRYRATTFYKKIDTLSGQRSGTSAVDHEVQLQINGSKNDTDAVTTITIVSENADNLTGTVNMRILG